jgi:hypothetical protein
MSVLQTGNILSIRMERDTDKGGQERFVFYFIRIGSCIEA